MKACFLVITLIGLLCTSCSQVQPWQRETLSKEPMLIKDCPLHRFERSSEVYREGSVGGTNGKSGGGCGCS